MIVWLITIGEPLPIDKKDRLHRTGILAKLLVTKGHRVIWWTSTFDHVRKEHRFNRDTYYKVANNFEIKLLHSIGYRKNISLSRFINHYLIARSFLKNASEVTKPDIILCSLPTLELSLSAVRYGKKMDIPVVLDMRDMWPEVFLDFIPYWAKGIAKIIFSPMYSTLHKACNDATCITGITQGYVEWGVKCANRTAKNLDRYFPFGYTKITPNEEDIKEAKGFWKKLGINQDNNKMNVCYFGNLGKGFMSEYINVINAAKKLEMKKFPIQLIMCGRGENLSFYREQSEGCDNILFPGWINESQIWTLLRMSSIGLLPYQNNKSFVISYPNKSIEYLSAGLPIISSLKGVLGSLLHSYNCGITYESENVDDLVSKLIYLYNNPKIIKNMSKNALDLYKDKFVAEKVYNEMIDYLKYISSSYKKNKS